MSQVQASRLGFSCPQIVPGVNANRKMSNQRPKRESMSTEEVTVSNMWEIAVIVEILERKGLPLKGKG